MPKQILLTGASGVIGRAVLEHLDHRHTTCLVHSDAVPTAGESLAGDITERHLGLSRSDYDDLARRVDVIVHSAALTDYSRPEAEANAVNVEGLKNVLEFASVAEAHVYHFSTAFVLRHLEDYEMWTARSPKWWNPAIYLNSKRAGDEVVAASGLPVATLRPSVTFGDAATGATARFQGTHMLIREFFSNHMQVIPAKPEARIDYLPTNVIGELVARLTEVELTGELWLTAGEEAITAGEMLRIFTDYSAERELTIPLPRMVGPDMVERLIIPVFLPEVPKRLRRRWEMMLTIAPLFFHDDPYPSDTRELERKLGANLDFQLESSFIKAVDYWRANNKKSAVPA